jgi:hypothetical protein
MPQPIDFQTELVRTTTAERAQQVADRLSLVATQRSAQELDAERVAVETEVQETHDKPEEINRDLKRRNPYVGRRRRGTKAPENEEPEAPRSEGAAPGVDPHRLDITI